MSYDWIAIRKLLEAAFDDEALSAFCFDYYRDVYDQFTVGQTKGARVRLLIDYVGRQGLVEQLLAAVKTENPNMVARYESTLATEEPVAPAATAREPFSESDDPLSALNKLERNKAGIKLPQVEVQLRGQTYRAFRISRTADRQSPAEGPVRQWVAPAIKYLFMTADDQYREELRALLDDGDNLEAIVKMIREGLEQNRLSVEWGGRGELQGPLEVNGQAITRSFGPRRFVEEREDE